MGKHKRGFFRRMTAVTAEVLDQDAPLPLESGTYLANDVAKQARESARAKRVADQVTLIVYGWQNVEPGTLSWVFPSYDAALGAATAMRNAVRWAIVAGKRWSTLDEARASGTVLAEQV